MDLRKEWVAGEDKTPNISLNISVSNRKLIDSSEGCILTKGKYLGMKVRI